MVRSKRTKLREVEEPPTEENTEPEMESKDSEDEIEEPVAKKAKSYSEEPEEEIEENIVTAEEVYIYTQFDQRGSYTKLLRRS